MMFFPIDSATTPIQCAAPFTNREILEVGDGVVAIARDATPEGKVLFKAMYSMTPDIFDTSWTGVVNTANPIGYVDMSKTPMAVRTFDVARTFGMLLDISGTRVYYAHTVDSERDLLVGPCDGGKFVPIHRAGVGSQSVIAVSGNTLFTTATVPRHPAPAKWRSTDREVLAAKASVGIAVFDKPAYGRLVCEYILHEGDCESWRGEAADGSIVKVDAMGRMLSSSTADPATYIWVPALSM